MSKSTGNFLTLKQATDKFGADATRVALADAGDGIEDANFEESVANAVILKLYELRKWCEEMVQDARLIKDSTEYMHVRENERLKNNDTIQRTGEKAFWDNLFENEINGLVRETKQQYELSNYKSAMKFGLYDFTAARDFYREVTKAAGIGMHADLARYYIELQALMLCVVAPHWSEYIWLEVLKKPLTVQNALFPEVPASMSEFDAALEAFAKGKSVSYDPKKEKKLTIYCALNYPSWQEKYVEIVRESFNGMSLDMKAISKKIDKAESKKAMPFVQSLKKSLESGAPTEEVFGRKLKFDETEVLKEMAPGIKQSVQKCVVVEIIKVEEGGKRGEVVGGVGDIKVGEQRAELPPQAENAVPNAPTFFLENLSA
ncbi:cytosolic leucyl tRNA synthetase [Taxawa tesnikishii (nom. ined.)]|nr:cytosolic leucyl tRNA synthetase [Dothideales sp. JES 119]